MLGDEEIQISPEMEQGQQIEVSPTPMNSNCLRCQTYIFDPNQGAMNYSTNRSRSHDRAVERIQNQVAVESDVEDTALPGAPARTTSQCFTNQPFIIPVEDPIKILCALGSNHKSGNIFSTSTWWLAYEVQLRSR